MTHVNFGLKLVPKEKFSLLKAPSLPGIEPETSVCKAVTLRHSGGPFENYNRRYNGGEEYYSIELKLKIKSVAYSSQGNQLDFCN